MGVDDLTLELTDLKRGHFEIQRSKSDDGLIKRRQKHRMEVDEKPKKAKAEPVVQT